MPSIEGKIRYAVVGAGWISQGAFMPGVGQTTNSIMTAIVTGDPEKAKGLGNSYGLDAYGYDEYDKMLKSGTVDAIYVATPNFRHREFAVAGQCLCRRREECGLAHPMLDHSNAPRHWSDPSCELTHHRYDRVNLRQRTPKPQGWTINSRLS